MRLLDQLDRHATDRPDAAAYVEAGTGEGLTWRGLRDRVRAAVPHHAGPVVAIRSPNALAFPVAFLSALATGRAAFPLSPDLAGAEVEAALARVAAHPTGGTPVPRLLLLSSGSTGRPKVVVRSAAAVDAVCDQMAAAIAVTPADRVLATVPLCHSYGLEHGLLLPVRAGATTVLCRGLDVPTVRRHLLRSRITLLPGVPATFEVLAAHAAGDRYPAVRAAYSAGAPLPAAVADRCRHALGLRVTQLYGATEIGSVTYDGGTGTGVGRPMPGVRLRVGADGAVWVAAPSMFDGYLGDASPVADGHYPTGDLGHVDAAGNLVLTGRATLLVDVGGRKVNPLEVEAVLAEHPQVAEVVVVPVPQTQTAFRLAAVVVPRDASTPPDPAHVRRFARQRLAAYKVPRQVVVRPSLPRSPAGKVLRQQVQI